MDVKFLQHIMNRMSAGEISEVRIEGMELVNNSVGTAMAYLRVEIKIAGQTKGLRFSVENDGPTSDLIKIAGSLIDEVERIIEHKE